MVEQATSFVRVAAALVGAEAVALLGFAAVELLAVDSKRLALGVTTVVFFAAYGGGLALCARGLVSLQSWCRGPIVLAQIIQLGVAWSFLGIDTTWLAIALSVAAVVVLASVLAPSTTEALERGDLDDGRR